MRAWQQPAGPGPALHDLPLYTIEEPGVCNIGGPVCNGNRHSPAFTWHGEVVIMGWEPGGGAAPECEAADPLVKKRAFFYDADTGIKLGQWTLPRPHSAAENCTIHNYNVVPLRNGRYVTVSGNYQAGTWVTEFTNPASPVTLGWSDPLPLVPTQLRRGVVLPLVQRLHLRVGDHEGLERVPLQRAADRRRDQPSAPAPAVAGVFDPISGAPGPARARGASTQGGFSCSQYVHSGGSSQGGSSACTTLAPSRGHVGRG